MGITDLNNMGAAMAGAAYDTLTRHMKHRGTHPQDYDVIITGDLGQVGSDPALRPVPAATAFPSGSTTRTAG